MEYALWNGERISAFEVSKNYQLEKQVRQASGKKQLYCPDKDCENPILRYCHGEKKEAYFAHLNNNLCDYSEFDRNNTDIVRSIRRRFYDHFKSIGLNVELEIKILKHHYTHLLITTDSGKQIAVEFGTQRLSANHINRLLVEYQKQNIPVKWIVIGNINHSIEEDKVFFLKRFLLNESTNKDLIIVSWNAEEVAQYKIDPNEYKYKNREIRSENYPKDYKEFSKVEFIALLGEELEIKGFNDRYTLWLSKKKRAFDKLITQLENRAQKDESLFSLPIQTTFKNGFASNTIKNTTILPVVGMKLYHKRYGCLIITAVDSLRGIIAVRDENGEISHKGWNTLLANNMIEIVE